MTLLLCAEIIMNIFSSPRTLSEARFSPKYFTRRRKMPFDYLLMYLISGYKMAMQATLNHFFFMRNEITHMTQQALSKARNHFDHSPFYKAFNAVINEEYSLEKDSNLKRLYGYKIIAIDGSIIPLPNLPGLKTEFGQINNSPSARASIALDILNDRILDADLKAVSVDERTMAANHIEQLSYKMKMDDTILIFDRGYPSKDLVAQIVRKNAKYIMRVRKKFNLSVDSAPMGSSIIELEEGVNVRVVKFLLPSREVETLITNLFEMPTLRFESLYFLRWPVEIKYDIIKNKLELPNFTGHTVNIIYQDFWISMLLANVASIAKADADRIVQIRKTGKENKYDYQTNVNNIVASLRDRFADAVFCSNPVIRTIRVNRIIHEVSLSAVPKRPGRKIARNDARNVKYHHNKKSNV